MLKTEVRTVQHQRAVAVAVCDSCGATEDCDGPAQGAEPPASWARLVHRDSGGAFVLDATFCPPCGRAAEKFRRG